MVDEDRAGGGQAADALKLFRALSTDDAGRFRIWQRLMPNTTFAGRKIAGFPLWQLTVERLDPDSIDDRGALGRSRGSPDASRAMAATLRETEGLGDSPPARCTLGHMSSEGADDKN